MKTNKTPILLTVALSLGLLASVSCKRDSVSQPSPLGPSSIGVMLNLEASPNVIVVGVKDRQVANVTATLKKFDGTGQANRTVLFEVVDSTGSRLNVGFFEGSTGVFSKTTDANGSVHVNYFGPLSDEISGDRTIYIRASVAWDGTQFINDTAALSLVRDTKDLTLTAKAVPDVLYAGNVGQTSIIQATVYAGGQPAKNFPVYFVFTMNLGQFIDGKRSTTSTTNDQGVATMTYVGPTSSEMANSSETVPIRVQVSEQLGQDVQILIIRQQ
jgi:hypothetical protein